MGCMEFERMIVDYLSKELGKEEKELLENHLKVCDECSNSLDEYKNILCAAKGIATPFPDENFWTARLKEISGYRPRRTFLLKPVILVTSLLLLVSLFIARVPNDRKVRTVGKGNGYSLVLHKLPYSEDRILDKIEFVDDASAAEVLDVLFETNNVSYLFEK